MKKAIVMLLTFGTFVVASEARVNALGGNAAYWPGDEANVALFPQRVNDYNIAQFAGLGTGSTDHSGWVSWGESTKYGFSWAEGSDNDMVDFWWGNGKMGVNLGLGMSSYDNGMTGDAASTRSGMDLGVGFGMDMGFGEFGFNLPTALWMMAMLTRRMIQLQWTSMCSLEGLRTYGYLTTCSSTSTLEVTMDMITG